MARYAMETDLSASKALRSVLAQMLSRGLVDAIFVAARTPYSALPMPTLISDPQEIDGVDPLAPVAPFNAARQAAAVSRHPTGKRLALVLRPCEVRALVELVKLKQCSLDNVFLIGIECIGRLDRKEFIECASQDPDFTETFYRESGLHDKVMLACKVCEHFEPKGADMTVSVLGVPQGSVGLAAQSEAGEKLLMELGLSASDEPEARALAAKALLEKRVSARDILFRETAERINTIEKFERLIANCLNCHGCRTACPVCYCKECVFLTDVFSHRPEVLLRRASKRRAVKMPAETSMFHMTRLAHMGHACVGCGHCGSVCPSDVPVFAIFRTVAAQVQALFDYEPGRSVSETIPYLAFGEPEGASD